MIIILIAIVLGVIAIVLFLGGGQRMRKNVNRDACPRCGRHDYTTC